jgi:short-subunit dehydrogenase
MATGLASAGAEIVIVSRHEAEAKAVAEHLAKNNSVVVRSACRQTLRSKQIPPL